MVTQPDDPVVALAKQVAALQAELRNRLERHEDQLVRHERRLTRGERRADDAGIDGLGGRFDDLAATVTAALDAASPRGPAVPRWDRMDPDERAEQLAQLRAWVRSVLVPCYLAGGSAQFRPLGDRNEPTQLRPCWDSHEPVLWKLGPLWAEWRRLYGRPPPAQPGPVRDVLEFNDRWLSGVLRWLAEYAATAGCDLPGHGRG